MTSSLHVVSSGPARHSPYSTEADHSCEGIESRATLEPGCFWRAKDTFEVLDAKSDRFRSQSCKFEKGDIHLLVSLNMFDDQLQSVQLLEHPRYGHLRQMVVPVDEFMTHFEPASDEEAQVQRDQLQAQVMAAVQGIQEEMAQATSNPLSLPGVRDAAEEAVKEFEAAEQAKAMAEATTSEQREQDIRRIHRRAARRSDAKGNPLALRRVAVSDSVSTMVSEGITADGVRELALESGRRIAIATAASKWLQKRAADIGNTLKKLTPYFEEKGQVALAKSSEAIAYVETLSKGITSLKLYTGEGVTVVTVREGLDAHTAEPLSLLQGKRFMDEELAVWAHVEDSFDCESQAVFFEHLAKDERLFNQVLPLPRCVCTMAVTRRNIHYSSDMHWVDRMMLDAANRRVFLLVRNGGNVHCVYSTEPSHEVASRLFPTSDDLAKPFSGIDGTRIGLKDVAFAKAQAVFDDLSLSYKRFLILLAGLDHRERLFGHFYPPENALAFMSLDFQQRYFRFVQDDEGDRLLGAGAGESVYSWMARMNACVVSGSRVVVAEGSDMRKACAVTQKRDPDDFKIDKSCLKTHFVVAASKLGHFIEVPFVNTNTGRRSMGKAYLDGPNASAALRDWYLCVDAAHLSDVKRFLHSRTERSNGTIAWIRTLRRVEESLSADLVVEAELRQYLARAALEAGVQDEHTVDESVHKSIATWRAAHRGAAAPTLGDIANVHKLLTLMYPPGRLVDKSGEMIEALIAQRGHVPLKLTRTAGGKLALYVVATPEDREPYAPGVHWGWVKRIVLDARKAGFSEKSSTLVWLRKDVADATESEQKVWPALADWLHASGEPCRLSWLKSAKLEMASTEALRELLSDGRFAPRNKALPQELLWNIEEDVQRQAQIKYHVSTHVAFLVGVYQRTPESRVRFVYAMAKAIPFVRHYGSDADMAAMVKANHISRAARAEQSEPVKWRISVSKNLLLGPAISAATKDISQPDWTQQSSHERGGYKRKTRSWSFSSKSTRAQRRVKGGDPRHEQATHTLSAGRAFDTLMGVAPHLRKSFYSDMGDRLRWKHGKELMVERQRKFVPPVPVALSLVSLVWDACKGRSMANRFFWR